MSPPTVSSLPVISVEKIPVKVICIIALFIPLVPFMVENYYYGMGPNPPRSICSQRFPDYSRILDMPVTLPDGSIQSGGWVYPPEATWWDSGVAHGCPCRVGPCIRPCCQNGNYRGRRMYGFTNLYKYTCDAGKSEVPGSSEVRVLSVTEQRLVSTSRRYFTFLEANCKGAFYMASTAYLTTLGQVWKPPGERLDPAKYGICFNVRDDQLISTTVHACQPDLVRNDHGRVLKTRLAVIHNVVLGSVAVLLIITLVTYFLVPQLRPVHCNGSVVSYIFALLVLKILQIINVWSELHYPYATNYLLLVINSWFNCVAMWQCLIVFQMWSIFNPKKLRILNRSDGNTRFILYSVAIWGTFVFITPCSIYIKDNIIIDTLSIVIMLITLFLDVYAMIRLRNCMKAFKVAKGPESQRHNAKEFRWASLFLKFTFVTSLEFTILILFTKLSILIHGRFVQPNSLIWFVIGLLPYFLSLWGAEIFFMNVWSKRTWEVLKTGISSKSNSAVRTK